MIHRIVWLITNNIVGPRYLYRWCWFYFVYRSYSRAAAGAEVRGGQAEIEEGMNGTAALRRSVGGGGGAAGGGTVEPAPVATLVVYKDEAGYGMKVSGDNPVYVQSVKEGALLYNHTAEKSILLFKQTN